jgi:hypothetical protein
MKATKRLRDKGQSLWLDNITRDAPCRLPRFERIGSGINGRRFCFGTRKSHLTLAERIDTKGA